MKIYKFAKIAARSFLTISDLQNPWIFPPDVAVVVNVSQNSNQIITDMLQARGIDYFHYPLEEEVNDIGWVNIKRAVGELLKYDNEGKRIIVHCDCGQHRSRLVVEALYYAKYGEHLMDEYKGYYNHLIYDCQTYHLPDIEQVERELKELSQVL